MRTVLNRKKLRAYSIVSPLDDAHSTDLPAIDQRQNRENPSEPKAHARTLNLRHISLCY